MRMYGVRMCQAHIRVSGGLHECTELCQNTFFVDMHWCEHGRETTELEIEYDCAGNISECFLYDVTASNVISHRTTYRTHHGSGSA